MVDENVIRGLQEPNPAFSLQAMAQYLLIQCQGNFIEHNYGE